ncbi:chloroplast envelope quinone oxidoreductase homolog isoform X2 [Phaseolus vulgaris]|uniref:chloroplast envelope quinone oxidoreductase homolog isoform X2 n=1 Tax=Phaseolus vulgaris TaxID=3885 RepID=UPI0035CA43EC
MRCDHLSFSYPRVTLLHISFPFSYSLFPFYFTLTHLHTPHPSSFFSTVDMGKLMHAVQYNSYGGGPSALRHVEVPLPTPSKGEVLIKLEAASLNPFDWKVQKGMLWPLLPCKFPYIPGSDITGEVIEVGKGVQKFKPGDKVVALVSPFSGGGLAEYAVAKESITASRPSENSASESAGLPVAGLTALQAITKTIGIKLDGSGERKNILITAASGGVGHYAIQLAKLGNTHVTATCGARNIELVKSLGADEVIDYKTPDGAALKSPSGKKYDAVVHCAVGFPWSTFEPNLTLNGKVVDITPSSASMLTFALKKLTFSKKQLVPLFLFPKGEDLQYLIDLVKEGKLKTVVDSKCPLTKAEDAWAKSIDGHATGKIIIEF